MTGGRAQHLDWLSLVDVDGQFLSLASVRKAFPAGLDAVPQAIRAEARARLEALETAESDASRASWIDWLLRDALGWGERYRTDDDVAKPYDVPEYRTAVLATGALVDPLDERLRAVVLHVPYRAPFDERLRDEAWNASPLERAALLARVNHVPIALIEDGERIALLNVPAEGAGGHATWQTDLFGEGGERTLFASFVGLLDSRRFFNVVPEQELAALFAASAIDGAELTKTLGFQVRRAVELFVAALSSADRDERRRQGSGLLEAVVPHDVYVAAATVMMRTIFLLYAEERGLLPLADPLYARSYALATLREQIEAERLEFGDEPLERRCTAWRRMLATFSAVYAGVEYDRLRLPAYGGRLFDPSRFPFLLDARIDDLTIATVLGALQVLEPDRGAAARRLSFRELDVEQIGHVYEGLLDHDVRPADGVVLGFTGKAGDEPEVDLVAIEAAAARGRADLTSFLCEATGRAERAVGRDLERGEKLVRERDVETVRRVRRACENDVGIAERVLPYAPFLRNDLHGVLTVYLPGSLVVRKTRARRDSGTEYTPRVLAEEIVRYTLEPLCFRPGPAEDAERATWAVKPSEELLALKVCDPACGSGAFLVSACRYLADRVVEAWEREGRIADDDPTREAQRLVAQRCLYGVDRDGMAVEMAKLSLWLLTFARERPFGFLDHAIREGDSLLGVTSLDQVRYLHRDPERGKALHHTLFDPTALLERLVGEAGQLRRDLEMRVIVDVRDAEEQAKLQAAALSRTRAARAIADGLVGIELALSARPERERDAALVALGARIRDALQHDPNSAEFEGAILATKREAAAQMNAGRPSDAPIRSPLHWPLEFPEVFSPERLGFAAIVGNPPFLGGTNISARFGRDYLLALSTIIPDRAGGRCDLVAYFLRRSAKLCKRFGFVATNSVAEGDTRHGGLNALLGEGWRVLRTGRSRHWAGGAAVQVMVLILSREATREAARFDGEPVEMISALLVPGRRSVDDPKVLAANRDVCFEGTNILGEGFIVSPSDSWWDEAFVRDESAVIRPILNGQEVCESPSLEPRRWVVSMTGLSEREAATRYPRAFAVLEARVKPDRQRKRPDGSFVLRKPLPQQWWLFNNDRRRLYALIASLKFVIVLPKTSKFGMARRVPTSYLFSHALAVFATDDNALYGLITSGLHRSWARSRGSTMRTDTRYAPTDCFETFPLPDGCKAIGEVMSDLHEHRAALMLQRQEGITTTYNRFHDPSCGDADIVRLRELHLELDGRVLAAYGWQDLDVPYDFRATEEGLRFTFDDATRVELLDRLLEMNHARHAAEVAAGLHGPQNGRSPGKTGHSPLKEDLQPQTRLL
jgi:hypothetical protein